MSDITSLIAVTNEMLYVSDIDECDTGTSSCDGNAECINTNGSYTCSCKPGYNGDGKNWEGASSSLSFSKFKRAMVVQYEEKKLL